MNPVERLSNNKRTLPYLLIAPVSVWLGLTIFYPILDGVRLSFFDTQIPISGRRSNFVFLANYVEMFSRPEFWHSFRVTLVYTLSFVLGCVVVGFLIAMLLNINFKGRVVARSAIIVPWAMPYVVSVLVFRWILDYNFGFANYVLKDVFHVVAHPIAWITSKNTALFTVIMIAIWKEFPIAAVMYLAGLQTIPEDLHDAARVDGASRLQRLFRITLPLLGPVNRIVILLLTIWSFKRVTVIYVLTKGGPARATETLVIQSYLQAFNFFHMSYSAAIGTFMLAVSFVFSLLYLRLTIK